MIDKPFSRTEMKMLIYNKVKNGMSYEQAKEQLSKEIEEIRNNNHESKKVKKTIVKFKLPE